MKRIKQLARALFIAVCLCYISNVGGVQGILARACEGGGSEIEVEGSAACVTRSGGDYICDCTGDNCGKRCTRDISLNCPGGTCKAAQ
jgi:hypothetical protein